MVGAYEQGKKRQGSKARNPRRRIDGPRQIGLQAGEGKSVAAI